MLVSEMLIEQMRVDKITLKKLSEETGLSVSYLCELKNNVKVPTSKRVIELISKYLSVSYEEFSLICKLSKIRNKRNRLDSQESIILNELKIF